MDPTLTDPEPPSRPVNWITIRTYLFEYEAVFARDLLRTHGLGAQILDAGFIGVAPHMANAVGGVRLQVDARDREDAQKILAAPYLVPDPMPGDDEGETGAAADAAASDPLLSSRLFDRSFLIVVAIIALLAVLWSG